jgi:Ribbon-helix-helix protein, copG family
MRTTVRLDDHLLRKVRQYAVREGKTMTAVLREALLAYLARPASGGAAEPLDLPRSGRGGTLPGVDLDDTAALHEVMDGRR